MTTPGAVAPPVHTTIHRIEVWPKGEAAGGDPKGAALVRDAAAIGVKLASAKSAAVYLVEADLDDASLERVRTKLLADPVTERSLAGASAAGKGVRVVEVHPLPGVMDPVAQSVEHAIREMTGLAHVRVSTGWRYELHGCSEDDAKKVATRLIANPVIQRVVYGAYAPEKFPVGASHEHAVRHIPILKLDDAGLLKLSREGHLFLSLDEMKAIQSYYRGLSPAREPTDIELETLAQTWSEHCVHKTLKSNVRYSGELDNDVIVWQGRPGHEIVTGKDGKKELVIRNLLKSTVAAATHELIKEGIDWTLSVFVDNAGVIAFDDEHAVCVKVETHNHPSAIEPYGGAATGIGGCIRDVIGTGLAARPIASTDVFCVAFPDGWEEEIAKSKFPNGKSDARYSVDGLNLPFGPLPFAISQLPPGCLHPRRILSQVVAGVRDYGNRMGIPTVSGAVAFDNRYVGNPLVFCGCIGVMPRDRVKGKVNAGDLIVALGGRTGRDGIHGATFSSTELEHTSADEFAHAVQIGNAIEEKRVLDAIIRARDEGEGGPLFSGLTDCGAGGFSSAVGEMGKDVGATVYLERAPLKYEGLSYTEVWISEAQERMVLAVPKANLAALQRICDEERVELAVLGEFGPPEGSSADDPALRLMYHGTEVGRLSMHLMHEGIPTPHREAKWDGSRSLKAEGLSPSVGHHASDGVPSVRDALLQLLSHPNIASKHWVIRQYDHEVRGNTVVKPLVGPRGRGPGDASVVQPVPGSKRGLAISQGLQTGIGDREVGGDPYLMVLAAVDECVRNLVCVGADPEKIAILDNFCWPSCGKPENLGALVRAAEGCYDAAKAYKTPFVSGKDSLNNQLTIPGENGKPARTIEIPYTLLVTGMGIVGDVSRCVTMDAKDEGNVLLLVEAKAQDTLSLGGSHFQQLFPGAVEGEQSRVPVTDLVQGPAVARRVAEVISRGVIRSAHDVSDGGVLCAVAEMLIAAQEQNDASSLGIALQDRPTTAWFDESPSRYVLEVAAGDVEIVRGVFTRNGHAVETLGVLDRTGQLTIGGTSIGVDELAQAWLKPLDW